MLSRFGLALALAAGLSGPVHALSCLRPDVVTAYEAAEARAEGFVAALGRFTDARPPADRPGEGEPYSFPARFTGHLATRGGFDRPVDLEVTVEIACIVAWCGPEPSEDEVLVFLRLGEDGGHVFESQPCETFLIRDPSRADIDRMMGCLRGGGCTR